MAFTVTAGNTRKVVSRAAIEETVVDIRDGFEGWITDRENQAPETGVKVEPGQRAFVDPAEGVEKWLHAVTDDLVYDRTIKEPLDTPRDVEKIEVETGANTESRLFRPINHVDSHDAAAPGANTDILASDIQPLFSNSILRVSVSLATSSVFNAQIGDGSTTIETDFNDGSALTAGALHIFDMSITDSVTINFQVETDSEIDRLQVDEIPVAGP